MSGADRDPSLVPRNDRVMQALAFAAQRFLASASWRDRIDDVLERLGEAVEASHAYVFENQATDGWTPFAARAYGWAAPEVTPQIDDPATQRRTFEGAGWSRWAEALRRGEPLHGIARGFPEPEAVDLKAQNIASIAEAPIFVGGEWWGLIGLDESTNEREWLPSDISALEAVAAILGAAIDRQAVREQLSEAMTKYRWLVEHIPAMTFVDEAGGPEEGAYVSPQIRDLLGFEPEDWHAEPEFWRNHIHPDDEPEVWADWRRSVEEGGIFAREYRMLSYDGSVVWVSERSTILPDENGKPRWIQGVLTDISQLKEAEDRFRTVFEASPIGIGIVGTDFRMLDANRALCRLLGYTRDEMRTRTFIDFTHSDDADLDAELAKKMFAGDIPNYSLEKRFITSDGETLWVNLTASVVNQQSRTPMLGIGIVEDITERKRREAVMLRDVVEANRRLVELSQREREVLDLMASEGLTAPQVAAKLHISKRTAESHLASVYRTLHVSSRDAAIREYRRLTEAAGGA
ncbi:MAG: PAS domain S-box protein [Actinomycetota bacterium]|nr:PAS domain S-box protein [Actinomycetota bacterium]